MSKFIAKNNYILGAREYVLRCTVHDRMQKRWLDATGSRLHYSRRYLKGKSRFRDEQLLPRPIGSLISPSYFTYMQKLHTFSSFLGDWYMQKLHVQSDTQCGETSVPESWVLLMWIYFLRLTPSFQIKLNSTTFY